MKLDGTTLSWQSTLLGQKWAVFKNDKFVAFTGSNSYTVDDADAEYAVRAVNQMGGLGEAVEATTETIVTLSKQGYATFYDSKRSYILPEGIKAYIVTEATQDALTYSEINGIINRGVAVMLESADKKGGDITLKSTSSPSATYIENNLLKGSDETTTTTANEDSWFYKLTYGAKKSPYADIFGWFWGAADGAAFQIEGHRAWLAIPKGGQNAPALGYSLDAATTGISVTLMNNERENTEIYNLNGQRVTAPAKGLYIVNGKKVVIK